MSKDKIMLDNNLPIMVFILSSKFEQTPEYWYMIQGKYYDMDVKVPCVSRMMLF